MFWRALAATVGLTAALTVHAPTASAYELGWWEKASGVATCVIESGNHFMCGAYDTAGTPLGVVVDIWFDWYCQPGPITSGSNATGSPLQIRFLSPVSGAGCWPNSDGSPTYWNQYYGWYSGAGYSGQLFYNPWYVAARTYYVVPRNPADPAATGTIVEVW